MISTGLFGFSLAAEAWNPLFADMLFEKFRASCKLTYLP